MRRVGLLRLQPRQRLGHRQYDGRGRRIVGPDGAMGLRIAVGQMRAQQEHHHALAIFGLRADPETVAVEHRFVGALQRAGHGDIGQLQRALLHRRSPRGSKALATRRAAQRIGALHAHLHGARRILDTAAIRQRLDEGALFDLRPPVLAPPPPHRHPAIIGRIEPVPVHRRAAFRDWRERPARSVELRPLGQVCVDGDGGSL